MEELFTLVCIDIADDRLRRRAVEMLFDYGLQREQYSVFAGPMTRNRREELYTRLRVELRLQHDEEGDFGRIAVVPVGEREARSILRFELGRPGQRKKKESGKREPDDAPATEAGGSATTMTAESASGREDEAP